MLKRHQLALSAAALALSAGCSTTYEAPPPAAVVSSPGAPVTSSGTVVRSSGSTLAPVAAVPVVVPATTGLRAGNGRIESLSAVPTLASSSAGASVPSTTRRVGMKMDDGTVQFFDTDAPGLSVGDRIEITSDGYLKRG